MTVKTCPIMEAIAKKLFGIETIADKSIKSRMINSAVKAGKDAAEQVCGGSDTMRLRRENAQLKEQNAMLYRKYNNIYKKSMSLEKVQKMAFELANQALTDGYQCSNDYTEADVVKFIEEWRKNNDC